MSMPSEEMERLRAENRRLAGERDLFLRYIRAKTDELLVLLKCPTLNADALGDLELVGYDPIGTIGGSFAHVLENLNETNRRLQEAEKFEEIFEQMLAETKKAPAAV